jgi:3-dehydroquinate synthase
MSVRTVRVELGTRGYPIRIGPGLIDRAGAELLPILGAGRSVVVSDTNLAQAGWVERLVRALDAAGIAARTVIIEPGEGRKSWAGLERVVAGILGGGADRRTAVVALGGGVIGDLAGFAAAITLRGLPFVQVPTSLLAQVDSSVGGKTGINAPQGKNLVGAFHQPVAVLADTDALATLPAREIRAGYAEIAKHGLLADERFFAWLEQHGPALVAGDVEARVHAVVRSCEIKAAVVAADEFETTGQRATLNLGHTFAHAYEALTGYSDRLLHGEAVALGLVQATELSVRMRFLPADATARVRAHLAACGLRTRPTEVDPAGFAADAMLAAMAKDKKAVAGRLAFVLLRRLGEAFLSRDVPEPLVRALLDAPA